MADTLGAVVVGTGFGVLTHLRALRAAGFEGTALVGRDPAKTAERAAHFGVPHACTSLAEAFALDGTEVVAVATPPHTHGPLVLEAVAAGRHVLCEKPFARDVDEARRMLAAAEAARAKTAERYEAFITALGRRLAKGPKLRQEISEDVAADGGLDR